VKLTAVVQAVSAAAERLNIAVSAQEKRMAAGVSTSPMALAYEIGQWILAVNKSDGTSTLDELFLDFFKTKTDNVVLAEELSLEFHKALRDEAGLTDDQAMAFFKGLGDTASFQDDLVFAVGKGLNDNVALSEDKAFALTKLLADHLTATDDIDGAASIMMLLAVLDNSKSAGAGRTGLTVVVCTNELLAVLESDSLLVTVAVLNKVPAP
jgi:hypothetical protein